MWNSLTAILGQKKAETISQEAPYDEPFIPGSRESLGPTLLTQAPVESPASTNELESAPSSDKENAAFQNQVALSPPKPDNLLIASQESPSSKDNDYLVVNLQDKLNADEERSIGSIEHDLGTQSPPMSEKKTPLAASRDFDLATHEDEDTTVAKKATYYDGGSFASTLDNVPKSPDTPSNDFAAQGDDGDVTTAGPRTAEKNTRFQDQENDGHLTKTPTTADGDVNDDSDTDSNSSDDDDSSSSEEEQWDDGMLKIRRAENVARNEAKLEELGLQHFKPQKTLRPKKRKLKENIKEEEGAIDEGGMLLLGSITCDNKPQDLSAKYPGREPQIRLMKGILHGAIAQLDQEEAYISPPLFVSGPGACKTSVTRDVVESLLSPRVGSAYINCATLEPSSIEALVESAYQQIALTFKQRRDRKKKRRKTTLYSRSPMARIAISREAEYNEDVDNDMEDRVEQARSLKIQAGDGGKSDAPISAGGMEDEVEQARSLQAQPDDDERPDAPISAVGMEDEVEQARSLQAQPDGDEKPDEPIVEGELNTRTRYSRQSKGTETASRPIRRVASSKIRKDAEASSSVGHCAPLAFGRSLAPFIGENGPGSAFLILDHAERLMTLHPNQTNSRLKTNYLAQLLLLPKVIELKLTIIVITTSSLLMNSRIDNATSVEKSIGTLDIGLHPIRINFPAYSGNDIFKAILKTPDNLATLVGTEYNSEFHQVLINSFVSALVQAMCGMTRDVRDMLRAGRRLWPAYIEPLSLQNIEFTMKGVEGNGEVTQKALLSYLDQRMVKLSKNIEDSLLSLGGGGDTADTASELPYLSKCLLLASFICQHNKADKDKQLFTNTGNGKRRRQRQEEGDAESAAFGTWNQQRLKMLRPRSFPLERMLSIFVNIVGLHEGKQLTLTTGTTASLLSSLGNSVFLETVGQLRAIGLLREIPSEDGINLSAAMYCCDVGKDDAKSLAQSIGFSLEKYLL